MGANLTDAKYEHKNRYCRYVVPQGKEIGKVSAASIPGARIKDICERVESMLGEETTDEVLIVLQAGVCDIESAPGATVLRDLVDLAVATKSARSEFEVRVAAVPEHLDRGWVVR